MNILRQFLQYKMNNQNYQIYYQTTDVKLEQIVISEQEVVDMLETFNIHKASGPDDISNKMVKSAA